MHEDPSTAARALAQRRWRGTTPEQRRQATAAGRAALMRRAVDRRITELVEAAPPLTDEQAAKLSALLGRRPAANPTPIVDPVRAPGAELADRLSAAGGSIPGLSADQAAELIKKLREAGPRELIKLLSDLGQQIADRLSTVDDSVEPGGGSAA